MADNDPIETSGKELSAKNNDEQNINLDLNGSSNTDTKNHCDLPDSEGGTSQPENTTTHRDTNITSEQNVDNGYSNSPEVTQDTTNQGSSEHNPVEEVNEVSENPVPPTDIVVNDSNVKSEEETKENNSEEVSPESPESSESREYRRTDIPEVRIEKASLSEHSESASEKPQDQDKPVDGNTPSNENDVTGSNAEKPSETDKEEVSKKEEDYSESFEESEGDKSDGTFPSYNSDHNEGSNENEAKPLPPLNEEDEAEPELTSTPRHEPSADKQDLSGNSDATLTKSETWPSYEKEGNEKETANDKPRDDSTNIKEDSNHIPQERPSEETNETEQAQDSSVKFYEETSEDKQTKEENLPAQSDDTLDDIEPISTISEVHQSESTVKPSMPEPIEQEPEPSDVLKSDPDKSADDNARADEHPKREIVYDTDHETEDLRSEEVDKSDSRHDSKSSSSENVNSSRSSVKDNSSSSQSKSNSQDDKILRSSQSSRIKFPASSESEEEKKEDNSQETSFKDDSQKQDESSKSDDTENKGLPVQNQRLHVQETVSEKDESEKNSQLENDGQRNAQKGNDDERPTDETEEDANEVENEPESARTPSPEPELVRKRDPVEITRNVTVDHAVDTITQLEESVRNLLDDMKELTTGYHDRLKAQPMSSFVEDMGKFRGDFQSMQDAYKKCESLFMYLNKTLKELRVTGDELNTTIDKKLREEDLDTWMEGDDAIEEDKNKIKEQTIAASKSAIARANDAKTHVAKAVVSVTESSLFAAECEAEAAEAFGVSARAWAAAKIALRDAEAAQKAAEEKRLAAEEARKRAEERAKKRADEEKKKREEEDAILAKEAKRKGVSFEDEKNRAMSEKARKEAERRDPKNWPRNIYSIEPGDFDPGVGCVVRAIDGCIPREEIEVRRLDQLSGVLTLVENEELISNIIEITPTDLEKRYIFEEPFAVAIPHCAGRGAPGREPIIKNRQQNGRWVELPTRDVIFDDIRELRFVEAQTRKFGLFAVVLRLKRDTMTFIRKGNKTSSTADSRVTFTCPSGMFKSNVTSTVEVQQIETSVVADLKLRRGTECEKLLASSPIVRFNIPNRKFPKPLTMTLPLPPNPSRTKRPTTAVPQQREKEDIKEKRALSAHDRPLVSFNAKEDEVEEDLHLIVRDGAGPWCKIPDINIIQAKNKDIVTFDINQPHDKFLVLRTTLNATVPRIEAIAGLLETSLLHRNVNFFLRQQSNDPNDVILSCSPANKTEKEIRKLTAEGYDDGPAPTRDIIVREGQIIEIRFRGNIDCESGDSLKMIYNTHIRSKLDFKVGEKDRFAQKGFNCFRGFAQMFTTVQRQLTAAEKAKTPNVPFEEEELLLSELLINIPKPEPEPPRPLTTAPIRITAEGPDSEDVLQYVAGELGDEWKKLAQYLNLKSVRIQAILRQNHTNPDPKRVKYDMLVTWAKRVPRSLNKLEILSHALLASGRGDLAEELRERDIEFKRRRSAALRDTYLQRAFIKVAQSPTAVKDWKLIAKRMGVTEIELSEIEKSRPSIQEKCYHSLRKWQSIAGEEATLPALGQFLRRCNYRGLARDIEAIG